MPIPSTMTGGLQSQIMTLAAAADLIGYTFPCSLIRWHLTTAVTSAWALQVTQCSSVASTLLAGTTTQTAYTVDWPLIGTTTQSISMGGSTAAGTPCDGFVDFPVNNWLYGLRLNALTGGFITVIKAPPGAEWVRNKPPGF
jgi:hypothetical protein